MRGPDGRHREDVMAMERAFVDAGIGGGTVCERLDGTWEMSFGKDDGNFLSVTVGAKPGDIGGFSCINGVKTVFHDRNYATQEIYRFAHDVGTGEGRWRDMKGFRYLSMTDMALRLGIRPTVLCTYRLPFPDVYIGDTRGWSEETFERWRKKHPQVGTGRGIEPKRPVRNAKKGRRRLYEW